LVLMEDQVLPSVAQWVKHAGSRTLLYTLVPRGPLMSCTAADHKQNVRVGGWGDVNVNELRLGFTTRNPEGILSHNDEMDGRAPGVTHPLPRDPH
jgi:hypothetical protein